MPTDDLSNMTLEEKVVHRFRMGDSVTQLTCDFRMPRDEVEGILRAALNKQRIVRKEAHP